MVFLFCFHTWAKATTQEKNQIEIATICNNKNNNNRKKKKEKKQKQNQEYIYYVWMFHMNAACLFRSSRFSYLYRSLSARFVTLFLFLRFYPLTYLYARASYVPLLLVLFIFILNFVFFFIFNLYSGTFHRPINITLRCLSPDCYLIKYVQCINQKKKKKKNKQAILK